MTHGKNDLFQYMSKKLMKAKNLKRINQGISSKLKIAKQRRVVKQGYTVQFQTNCLETKQKLKEESKRKLKDELKDKLKDELKDESSNPIDT